MRGALALVVLGLAALAGIYAAWSVTRIKVQGVTLGDDPVLPKSEFSFIYSPIREVSKVVNSVIAPVNLKYFNKSEFRSWDHKKKVWVNWYPHISPEALNKVDLFRAKWGAPVQISKALGGLGRHLGPYDESQHNIDKWDEVRALDFFPQGLNSMNAKRAYDIAVEVGFTGIGIYNDTSPGWMIHGDVRADHLPGDPAKWSRVNKKYLGIEVLIG